MPIAHNMQSHVAKLPHIYNTVAATITSK